MRKNAIKTASNFNFKDSIKDYYKILKNILEEKIEPIHYELTKKDIEELSNHLISDLYYARIMFNCKNNYFDANKQTMKTGRIHNLYVLSKEFIKANLYIAKKTIKCIIDKDYKL